MFEGIDHGMRPLIEAMNTVSYIETYSCCEGHPEEAAVKQYGYAVANVVLEIKHEPQNLVSWLFLAQEILRRRKETTVQREFAYTIVQQYSLNEDNNLGWEWEIKIQATGKTSGECRKGLDDGIRLLTEMFTSEAAKKQ